MERLLAQVIGQRMIEVISLDEWFPAVRRVYAAENCLSSRASDFQGSDAVGVLAETNDAFAKSWGYNESHSRSFVIFLIRGT